MRISAVELALLSFDLPHPVRFGAVEYRTRDYVALKLATHEPELVGYAIGYTRGTPLFEAAQLIAPEAVGLNPLRPRAACQALAGGRLPVHAAMVRAVSLAEVAMWDILAKVAGLPLTTVFGGARSELPGLAVGGYFLDVKGEEAVLSELVELEAKGYTHLKLMLSARGAASTRGVVARALDALAEDTQLGVDLHYTLVGRHDADAVLLALDDLGLAFVEDPFPPAEWARMAALAQRLRTPFALGEDVTSPREYEGLLRSASVLRVDPSTCGGFGAALHGVQLAASRGAAVIPHGIHGLSAQLAGGLEEVSHLEYVPPEISQDRLGDLLEEPFAIHEGRALLDDGPGNGLRLDWPAVLAAAAGRWATTAS